MFKSVKLMPVVDVQVSVEPEDPVSIHKYLQRFTALCPYQFRPMINFPTEPDDVFLGQLPKCGSTWLQQIVHQLRTGGDESFENIQSAVAMCNTFRDPIQMVATQRDYHPHVYKQHLEQYEDAMSYKGGRYINLVRDPIDTFWSWYNFTKNVWGCPELTVRDFYFQLYQHPSRMQCDYFRHIVSWWPHRTEPHVLWLHYEDLKADHPACVEKIGEFIGVKVTPELKHLVVERSSYEYMRANHDKFNLKGTPKLIEHIIRLTDEGENEIEKASIPKVRQGGGQAGQGSSNVPADVVADLHRRWREEVCGHRNSSNGKQSIQLKMVIFPPIRLLYQGARYPAVASCVLTTGTLTPTPSCPRTGYFAEILDAIVAVANLSYIIVDGSQYNTSDSAYDDSNMLHDADLALHTPTLDRMRTYQFSLPIWPMRNLYCELALFNFPSLDIDERGYAIMFERKMSKDFMDRLNSAITLLQNGFQVIKARYEQHSHAHSCNRNQFRRKEALTFSDISGILMLSLGAFILGLVVCFLEWITGSWVFWTWFARRPNDAF